MNYVSYFDALRFANWMNNGQESGDTESGAYTLLDGTGFPLAMIPEPGTGLLLSAGLLGLASWRKQRQ